MSYAKWNTYLQSGRDKNERPMPRGTTGASNARVSRYPGDGSGAIRLRLHWTDVVTLYPDGSEVINTGGWHTQLTMRFLSEHSSARVFSERGQLFVRTSTPEVTAPRVTKCRTCHGARQLPATCYAQWCHVWGPSCEHGQRETHRVPCEHGQLRSHQHGHHECWRCHGAGRVDYGSREVHYAWDGGPLRIDADGEPVGPPAPVISSPPRVPLATSPHDDYGERYERYAGRYDFDTGRYAREYLAELAAAERQSVEPAGGAGLDTLLSAIDALTGA